MKDGSAHPDGLEWVYCGEDGAQAPLWGYVPTVKTYALGKDLEQRPATDLERIANRYRDKLPAKDSANATEILEAARLLYIELYSDCGTEARRQKLKGANLIIRWLEKEIKAGKPTTEDKDRCRAFIVQDLFELGYTRKTANQREPSVYELAADISDRNDWNLGAEDSFKNAHKAWHLHQGKEWLDSGTIIRPYRKITQVDIDEALN